MSSRLAVVTTVAGRHRHLAAQHRSLVAGSRTPDLAVVVAMGDPEVSRVVDQGPLPDACEVHHEQVPVRSGLPLAAARNRGARRAVAEGADLLVFLDVDCLASPGLVAAYEHADARVPHRRPALLAGPVAYLPPLPEGTRAYDRAALDAARPHPARPAPPPGRIRREADLRLFWSLSFALRPDAWARIGGFDEGYTGYGAEDTDFAQLAGGCGARLWWVGGAVAFHQWHPVSDPPVEHLTDVVANANRFHRRWGWFPMEGWLAAYAERGLAHYDGGTDRWVTGPFTSQRRELA
jgi:N-acetylglucosaminyl-diphospho-decaprenol L-rhamnosyltransferase